MSYGAYVTTVNPGPIRTGFDQADPDGTAFKSLTSELRSGEKIVKIMEKTTRTNYQMLLNLAP